MKKIFSIGVLLSSLCAIATAAPLLTVELKATGRDGVELHGDFNYSQEFSSFGDKSNVRVTYRDEVVELFGTKYLHHYEDTAYDQWGGFLDRYRLTISGDQIQGSNFALFNSTMTIGREAASSYMRTAKVTLWAGADYSSSIPGFPYVEQMPLPPVFGQSWLAGNPWAMSTLQSTTYWNTNWKQVSGFANMDIWVGETATRDFLAYTGQGLTPRDFTMVVAGAVYDEGLHHRTESRWMSFDIMTPVPEPTTWAMLLAGVGIVGIARRRKTAA